MGSLPRKILGTILKIGKGEIQTEGSNDKENLWAVTMPSTWKMKQADYKCQEKKEGNGIRNKWVLHRYNISRAVGIHPPHQTPHQKTRRLIKMMAIVLHTVKQQNLEYKNAKKNNYMANSGDGLGRLHTVPWHG